MKQYENRLSIKECRRILGEKSIKCTDEEILEIRDWLYELATIRIEQLKRKEDLNIGEEGK